MAVSDPEVCVFTDTSADNTSINPENRARPSDPSPSKVSATQKAMEPLDVQMDSHSILLSVVLVDQVDCF